MRRQHSWILFWVQLGMAFPVSQQYRIGAGRADCTGPAAEVTFMGYGKPEQQGCGIHLRQFSRAFIVDDGIKRVVFVSVDAGMISHGVRREVLSRLSKLYSGTYTDNNLILSGTHTHCAPGGFLMDFMYDLPSLGFVKDTFDALVDGITKSVIRAHENVVDGKIFLSSGDLLGITVNRSPLSYLLNPEEERSRYEHDVDKNMVQLRFTRNSDGATVGVVNWYAIHPTSMNNTNCLITSDNVGYASILLEKSLNNAPAGTGKIVAAFASSNLGDVSPNVRGPRCINTGEECDKKTSTCDGLAKYCIASGPGKDMFESTSMIATKLYQKAKSLLKASNSKEVQGSVGYIHQYVDMPTQEVSLQQPNGTITHVRGCLPAMGYSFAAGTTDGVGEFDFHQATVTGTRFWNTVRDILFKPTEDDIACHHPKPIFINSGRAFYPVDWQPRVVSTQIVEIGEVMLIAVPGEFTTMSGRRLRDRVKEVFLANGRSNIEPIIVGLSNTYASYIATFEEYQLQRYEGASTIFGPHTLAIYLKIYADLAEALVKGQARASGLLPPDLSPKVVSFRPGVFFDTSGLTHSFGDCIAQPTSAKRGTTVTAKFIAGHPRNDLMLEKTFLTIEKLSEDRQKWIIVATDAEWETKFVWRKTSQVFGGSEVTVLWDIPMDATKGTYRISHLGHYKTWTGNIVPYGGTSDSFQVG